MEEAGAPTAETEISAVIIIETTITESAITITGVLISAIRDRDMVIEVVRAAIEDTMEIATSERREERTLPKTSESRRES